MKIEISRNDLDGFCNRYDFQMPSHLAEEGWRLPSPQELRYIFDQPDTEFEDQWYMTDDFESDFYSLSINFSDKRELRLDCSESHWGLCKIRLVRDI